MPGEYLKGFPDPPNSPNEKFLLPSIPRLWQDDLYRDLINNGVPHEIALGVSRSIAQHEDRKALIEQHSQKQLEWWANTHTHPGTGGDTGGGTGPLGTGWMLASGDTLRTAEVGVDSWSSLGVPFNVGGVRDGLFDGTNFTVVGGTGTQQTIDGDLSNWTARSSVGMSTNQPRNIIWDGDTTYMVGGSTGRISRSFDGLSWSNVQVSPNTSGNGNVCFHDGYWFYCNSIYIWRYDPADPWEAASWLQVASISGITITGIASNGNYIRAFSSGGPSASAHIYRPTEADYTAWERLDTGVNANFSSDPRIAIGPSGFVLTGNNISPPSNISKFDPSDDTMAIGSYDGVTGFEAPSRALYYQGEWYLCLVKDSTFHWIKSLDGISWETISTEANTWSTTHLDLDVPSTPWWL